MEIQPEYEIRLLAECARKVRFRDSNHASNRAEEYGLNSYYCAFCSGYHLTRRRNFHADMTAARMIQRDVKPKNTTQWEPPTETEIQALAEQGKSLDSLPDPLIFELIHHTTRRRRAVHPTLAEQLVAKKWLHTRKERYWLTPEADRIVNFWINGLTINQLKALIAAREYRCQRSFSGTKKLIKFGWINEDGESITSEGTDILLAVHRRILRVVAGYDMKRGLSTWLE